jgi:metallophosphoesterase (TIGR03767 family)
VKRRATTLVVLTALATALPGSPAAAATDQQRLVPVGSSGDLRLVEAGGERHVVRHSGSAQAHAGRAARRRSLAYFAHLGDFQLADETSPARFEYLSGVKPAFGGFWRPQEAFGPHVVDQAVRAVNAHRVSPVPSAGGSAPLGFALMTGDMADNAQVNEVRWGVRLLEGGRINPFSGRRVSRSNPCRVPATQRRALNRTVQRRDYAGSARSRRALRRWPGALRRAQRPFVAEGLRVPWYSVRGNHDAVAQGHFGPRDAHPRSAPTACRKVFSSAGVSPALRLDPWAVLRAKRGRARLVPPDPSRRFASPAEFRGLHPRGNPIRRSLYYAWSPRRGVRFIGLDTVADAGGASGNLDHPQYLWLARELRRAERRRQLVVVYGHHPLEMMTNATPGDRVHLGRSGNASLRSLLLRHDNVVLYVAGHKHYDRVWPNFRPNGRGFWQIITASLAGAPQQARLIELMDNRDGTLSVFGTMLDHAAQGAPPAGGPAAALGPAELASISRALAWERRPVRQGRRRPPSGASMRNVELVLRDPR